MRNSRRKKEQMKEKKYMNQQKHNRIIISGGGTGGHVFPAISIANALRRIDCNLEILFVGAEGRMEMERVPQAGYEIKGLPIAGFNRRNLLKNFSVLVKLVRSLGMAKSIIMEYKPDVVVGVGGYASGPVLRQSIRNNIPVLIQEQNSYAGITNKMLGKHCSVVCVAYDGMDKYFPSDKIVKTGNPVRHTFEDLDKIRPEALEYFSLDNDLPVVLVLGGSLGAGGINHGLSRNLRIMADSRCQWIWQTGKNYFEQVKTRVSEVSATNIYVNGFIDRMDYAYSAADVIISRAGAGTISELCLVGKPVILVPSPNVAEDHQTKNAQALYRKNAAILITDDEAPGKLVPEVLSLVGDDQRQSRLSENIAGMADRDADVRIAEEIIKLMKR
jgi:UDP-N-acetylglucosamine--N-acetylmuramyl-(pentapeptide) pyrophosphoryl-undecaprenol N-acetylglucosamine transferase